MFWPCTAALHGCSSAPYMDVGAHKPHPLRVLWLWPAAPSHPLPTSHTSWQHTVLEDTDEQGFISFSIPPVHWDLHVVDVWQQHIQLSAADKCKHSSCSLTRHGSVPGAEGQGQARAGDSLECRAGLTHLPGESWGLPHCTHSISCAVDPKTAQPSRSRNIRGQELLSAGRKHCKPARPTEAAQPAGWGATFPPHKLVLMELGWQKPSGGRQQPLLQEIHLSILCFLLKHQELTVGTSGAGWH